MSNKVPGEPVEGGNISAAVGAQRRSLLPAVERFASHYLRYNSPIGALGENPTTHTAEVRFGSGPELAVVKVVPLADHRWVNEALAWSLGSELKVGVPPKALLLVAKPDELLAEKSPGAVAALSAFGHVPMVMWCASRLDLQPPQQVWQLNWERAVMARPYGRRLAAFDAWLGNCDRIARNAPYWSCRGQIAAIDHERIAFAQVWPRGVPIHMDKLGAHETHLLKVLRAAANARKIKPSEVAMMTAELAEHSAGHADALAAVHAETEALISANFDAAAATNLLSFLSIRATSEFVRDRLEQL